MVASLNRTDLMDSSRLPGEAPAGTQGEASRRAGVVSETPSPRPARPPVVRPTERPNEPVQAGLPMGPGPGPTGLPEIGERERALARLRVAAGRSSSPALHRLLKRLGG